MNVEVPATSPLMREKLKSLFDNPASMTSGLYDAVTHIEGYENLSAAVRKDILDSITSAEQLWFKSVCSGNFPAPDELSAFQEFGRRRVHHGISLQSLLRAFRIGLRQIWNSCAQVAGDNKELRDELLFVISPYLMDFFDEMAQLVSQAYLDEQYQHVRWRDSLRHQLHEVIFNTPNDHAKFLSTTRALGLDPAASRIAIAVELSRFDRNSTTSEGQLDRLVLTAARHLKVPLDNLINAWHRDRLIIWAPCEHGDPMNVSDRKTVGSIAALMNSTPGIKAIGIGLASTGAKGWAASAEEASRAVSFCQSSSANDRVHCYSDIVIEESVRGTEGASRYLLSLTDQLSSEPDVLLTLETFFSNMQRRKVTAGALGIHPNTLDYRLERIENMLGAALSDPGWIAKLKVALALRRTHS